MNEAPENPKEFYAKTMSRAPEIVRAFYTALTAQDKELLLSCLTSDFTFTGPLAEFDTPEGFAEMVGMFGGWVETESFVIEGDQVVHIFTYHMTEPTQADIPICEVFTLTNGKIKSSRAYCDSKKFPQPEEA